MNFLYYTIFFIFILICFIVFLEIKFWEKYETLSVSLKDIKEWDYISFQFDKLENWYFDWKVDFVSSHEIIVSWTRINYYDSKFNKEILRACFSFNRLQNCYFLNISRKILILPKN